MPFNNSNVGCKMLPIHRVPTQIIHHHSESKEIQTIGGDNAEVKFINKRLVKLETIVKINNSKHGKEIKSLKKSISKLTNSFDNIMEKLNVIENELIKNSESSEEELESSEEESKHSTDKKIIPSSSSAIKNALSKKKVTN